ncbi:MAG TPA: hypothetical protein VFG50_06745 [Rhodothermales bacterium]|nr:hypothetical protein [Rhodothermales bacterium]
MAIIDHNNYATRSVHLGGLLLLLLLVSFTTFQTAAAQDRDEYRVDLGGYGSFRLDGNTGEDAAPSFTLRRFVVTTDARIGGRFQAYSEVEYERLGEIEVERGVERTAGGLEFEQELEGTNGSEIALEQAWVQYNLSRRLGLRFGAVLPPVGRFNLQHDDNLWNFPRRPLIDRAAQVLPASAAWTEMGLGFAGAANFGETGRLAYQAYLLTGTTLDFAIEQKVQTRDPQRNKLELEAVVSPTQGALDGSNAADAVAGRLEISPVLGSEYGLSAYFGRYTPEYLDLNESLTTLGLDGRQRVGPFYLEGEFLYSRYAGVDNVLQHFAQAAVTHAAETTSAEAADLESEIEIELTGLADRRYGFWLDLGYPIPLAPGTLGLADATLTPVVRYERVWLDDSVSELDFAAGAITELEQENVEQDRLSVGVAFRPIPQGVFHLTFARSNPIKGSLIDPVVDEDASGEAVNTITFGVAVGF